MPIEYIIGSNMPGYMPDEPPSEPDQDFKGCIEALAEDMTRFVDSIADGVDILPRDEQDEVNARIVSLDEAIKTVKRWTPNQDHTIIAGGRAWWVHIA